ncbi:hypothetical protein [uncultured Limnohabitans sp.]|uniref:hypothetical protein n=1 Tax=uncultured Limnohabitans sp. TaxID=768543 RepID=UPI002628DD1B|nr:hypothetical protein [uncultured Limnohabitans sp.]
MDPIIIFLEKICFIRDLLWLITANNLFAQHVRKMKYLSQIFEDRTRCVFKLPIFSNTQNLHEFVTETSFGTSTLQGCFQLTDWSTQRPSPHLAANLSSQSPVFLLYLPLVQACLRAAVATPKLSSSSESPVAIHSLTK